MYSFLVWGGTPEPQSGSLEASALSRLFCLLLGPTAVLREYIANQLTQELTMLRLSVDQRLKATEDQFNAKLLQLEKGPGKGGGKGKKK